MDVKADGSWPPLMMGPTSFGEIIVRRAFERVGFIDDDEWTPVFMVLARGEYRDFEYAEVFRTPEDAVRGATRISELFREPRRRRLPDLDEGAAAFLRGRRDHMVG